jgi:hypothetical protein
LPDDDVVEDDVPDAVLCPAEAGSATAMAAAAATLATPTPAVTAASLVLPLRRACCAPARSYPAGLRSDVMIALRFHGRDRFGHQ